MAQDCASNQPPEFARVALRYPEKTFYLGQVFDDTTNSYKLFWFLAVLALLKQSDRRSLRLNDILTEMAVAAWHPVCLYRLSLGRQDRLQDAILEIKEASGFPPNAAPRAIKEFLKSSEAAQAKLDFFKRYVPTRFLTPWFNQELQGIKDSLKDARIKTLARESQKSPFASPYYFEAGGSREAIRMNNSWHGFMTENLGLVLTFAEHHLALYLQARNPNVPGIVKKLYAPTARQLTAAHKFWQFVRIDLEKINPPGRFRDIYTEQPLGSRFTLDHFLPWSFVVHDLLWNLTPVEPATNSSKNDVLPDLRLYLPRLAKLHFSAIEVAARQPKFLEDYTDCFKLDVPGLLALGEDGLEVKYLDIVAPQTQIAINLGFQSGWRMRSPVPAVESQRDALLDQFPSRQGMKQAIPSRPGIEILPKENQPEHLSDHLPFYSLAIAAGGFLGGDAPDAEGWVNVAKHGFSKRISGEMFVTRIVGKSMEPTIKDGSYCVFRRGVSGSRQGRILIVGKQDFTDPETGTNYTVKRYRSAKSTNEDGWKHESIQLIPDNRDRQKFPILEFAAKDDAELQVLAEFIQMLTPAT